MKPSSKITDLAATLTAAASAPLVPKNDVAVASQNPKKGVGKGATVQLTLRPSKILMAIYVNKAAERSKLEGRNVTVQEIMLERLSEGEDV